MNTSSEKAEQPNPLDPVVRSIRLEVINEVPVIRANVLCDLLWVNFAQFAELYQHVFPLQVGDSPQPYNPLPLDRLVRASEGSAFFPWVLDVRLLAGLLLSRAEEILAETPSDETIGSLCGIIAQCRAREVRKVPGADRPAGAPDPKSLDLDSYPAISLVVGPLVIPLRNLVGRGPSIRASQLAELLRIEVGSLSIDVMPTPLGPEGWLPLAEVWRRAHDHVNQLGRDAIWWTTRCRDLAALLVDFAHQLEMDRITAEKVMSIHDFLLPDRQPPLRSLLDGLGDAPAYALRRKDGGGFEVAVSGGAVREIETGFEQMWQRHKGIGADALSSLIDLAAKLGALSAKVAQPEGAAESAVVVAKEQAEVLGRQDSAAGRSRRSDAELLDELGFTVEQQCQPESAAIASALRAAYDFAYSAQKVN